MIWCNQSTYFRETEIFVCMSELEKLKYINENIFQQENKQERLAYCVDILILALIVT